MNFEGALNQRLLSAVLIVGLLFFSGCATVQNNHDPIEGVNRVTDSFNDKLDRVTLKPLAKGYMSGSDAKMRKAISNFYDNLAYPNTILHDFLQGKAGQGFEDFTRFIINSTVGLAGLIDVATHMGLEKHQEDFGQTLAVWGASQGAYIVYPFLGPNSVRNTPNFITETATDGLFWAGLFLAPQITIPLVLMKYVDKRARLLDASDMRDELALDPYIFTREAWQQNREFLIYDGNPPAKQTDNADDDWEDNGDDWEDEDPGDESPVEESSIEEDSANKTPQPEKSFKSKIRIGDY
ncbi:MAG: VacJ family lipoprotein [Mariprofundaceae bacterium]